MILGIGIDLLNMDRLIKLQEKFGNKFAEKILSQEEISHYKKLKQNQINFLAKKFCAKEAFSKALGTGIGRGISFDDITVGNDILGKPIIVLTEKGCNFLESLYKVDYKFLQIDISITDENPFVSAFAIISKN
ncbi:MAG: holo-ACP synthase [Rickettsiales bacterium]|nr:holo-ACP synthase [Rickettsiales bacterium]